MLPERLEMFFGDDVVGTIHDTTPLGFEYADRWLNGADSFPVASIPLSPGLSQSEAVEAFFENLLPEGELRRHIAERHKASTIFAMLAAVAGDTAGGFVILPQGQRPGPPTYQKTTWKDLARQLAGKSGAAIDLQGKEARLSLAGAQDKALIAIFDDGHPRLPEGNAPSTHILKPDIKRLQKVWHSAVNEAIVMKMAELCGLHAAEVFYEPHTRACVVRRFDRIAKPDGSLGRIVQYDFCQLAGLSSEKKYESEGGPGIAQCGQLIRAYSTQGAVDLQRLIDWLLFNLYVGNNDSHAKNLSIHRAPEGGVVLTPFYDLMCTHMYSGLSSSFAFSVGGEFNPAKIGPEQIARMASDLGVRPQFVVREAASLAAKVDQTIDAAIQWITPSLPTGAGRLLDRLQWFVKSNTRKTAARIGAVARSGA
jgi:serine/threonine-protein kinase HipA